jgi:hypothetical protein
MLLFEYWVGDSTSDDFGDNPGQFRSDAATGSFDGWLEVNTYL